MYSEFCYESYIGHVSESKDMSRGGGNYKGKESVFLKHEGFMQEEEQRMCLRSFFITIKKSYCCSRSFPSMFFLSIVLLLLLLPCFMTCVLLTLSLLLIGRFQGSKRGSHIRKCSRMMRLGREGTMLVIIIQ